jgi:hypothetical protein
METPLHCNNTLCINRNEVSFSFDCESTFYRHPCKQLLPTHHWQAGIVLPTSYFPTLLRLTAKIDISLNKRAFGHKINGSALCALPAGTYSSIQIVLIMTFNLSTSHCKLPKIAHLHRQSIYIT